jgi:hypothetical protein
MEATHRTTAVSGPVISLGATVMEVSHARETSLDNQCTDFFSGCRQLTYWGCRNQATSSWYECVKEESDDGSSVLDVFLAPGLDPKKFFSSDSDSKMTRRRIGLEPRSRIRGFNRRRDDDGAESDTTSNPCDQAFDDAIEDCNARCPQGSMPGDEPPCTPNTDNNRFKTRSNVSSSKPETGDGLWDDETTPCNLPDDEATPHSLADKNGDGVLDLEEFMQWANYSNGGQLKDYKETMAWIRFFYAYDVNGNGVVEPKEVGRPEGGGGVVG